MTRYALADESPEYRKQRAELLEAEIALKQQIEAVAELRRGLPRDTRCEDYVLRADLSSLDRGGSPSGIQLSDLFEDAGKPLVLMQFMYGKAQENPCPMCTMWADGYDAVTPHLLQRVNFAVLVAGDLERFEQHVRSRGWRNLRIVSAGDSSIKTDLGFEREDGSQLPGVSVFTRAEDGSPRHFYSSGAMMSDGHARGMDLLSPVWNFFDLAPEGRGEFMPGLSYGE